MLGLLISIILIAVKFLGLIETAWFEVGLFVLVFVSFDIFNNALGKVATLDQANALRSMLGDLQRQLKDAFNKLEGVTSEISNMSYGGLNLDQQIKALRSDLHSQNKFRNDIESLEDKLDEISNNLDAVESEVEFIDSVLRERGIIRNPYNDYDF